MKNIGKDIEIIKKTKSSIPGLRRSPGGEHGNPFQYSCLGNPMDRGASWATVHAVTKSQTQLKQFKKHTHVLSTKTDTLTYMIPT